MKQIKKYYIRGNANRGHEVIAELEKLGGKNILQLKGDENGVLYYISTGYHIFHDRISAIKEESFAGQLLVTHPDWQEIELLKYKYPKTYEECCEVLSLGKDGRLYTKGYKASLIQDFQKLLICRDAYWKLYGEEIGLEKHWKPTWNAYSDAKYCIMVDNDIIAKRNFYELQNTLSFPTKKMRDVFYDNFIELIKECKELL